MSGDVVERVTRLAGHYKTIGWFTIANAMTEALEEITRLRAELARKVPEGWQVVPKVATDAMQNAATGDLYHHQDGMAWVDAERAWAAMLTAAPAPSEDEAHD